MAAAPVSGPHRTESFKFPAGAGLDARITGTAGLWMDPSQNAVVLCVGEEPQVRALE